MRKGRGGGRAERTSLFAAWIAGSSPAMTGKDERNKGSGTPANAGRTTCTQAAHRARHGEGGLRRPSAFGRARLPAFHHGSAQGVCGPLVTIRARLRGQTVESGGGHSADGRPTSSGAPRMPVVMPAGMMPGPPGSQADEAWPAGTAPAPATRHHPDGVP
jgi:hypothetical protein